MPKRRTKDQLGPREFWHPCSGCHESVMGQTVGGPDIEGRKLYGCDRGMGCSECGYSGIRLEKWTKAIEEEWEQQYKEDCNCLGLSHYYGCKYWELPL